MVGMEDREGLVLPRKEAEDRMCYQVWLPGKKIELRREGSTLPLEGVLQKAGARP